MACTTCKEKKNVKEEIIKSGEFVSKGVIWFAVIWSVLGVYGLYTLITKLI
jgi:hypothetical protein